ncbi:MAG TPA: SurA N-terminal domain-containing protein [Kofleriaceae bacterium]|jgi:parvulin-like peptidyl-prolyl isomerase|nr:SurA N-terminal domain-containing protein [Kofleriaceae bacterium]
MKTIAFVLLALAATAAADNQPIIGATATLDREVAIVERTPIWQSEIDELLARVPAQGFSPDQKKQALDSLIDGVLIEHTAKERQIETSDPEIDAAIKEVEQENHLDDAGLEKALTDQHYTREQYRSELARQIRAQRVYSQLIAPKVTVTDAEVDTEWAKRSKDKATPEQREQLRQAIWGGKMAQASQEWLAQRRATAHIEVKP